MAIGGRIEESSIHLMDLMGIPVTLTGTLSSNFPKR
jgi:hypothetical protein